MAIDDNMLLINHRNVEANYICTAARVFQHENLQNVNDTIRSWENIPRE